jgi:hypothetical protein
MFRTVPLSIIRSFFSVPTALVYVIQLASRIKTELPDCFGLFLCPSSGVFSVYPQHWYMSYMTYTSAVGTLKKLLMMDRGTVRSM